MHSRLYIWVARRDHFCVKSVCVFKLDLISSDDVHTSESVWRASHTTYVSGCAHTDERLSHSDDTISWDVGDRGRAGCIPSRRAARGRGSHFRPKSLTTPNQKQPGRKVNERFIPCRGARLPSGTWRKGCAHVAGTLRGARAHRWQSRNAPRRFFARASPSRGACG